MQRTIIYYRLLFIKAGDFNKMLHPFLNSSGEAEADVTNRIRIAREQSDASQFTQITTPRDNPNQTGCAHFGGRTTPQCPLPQPCGSSSATSAALEIESNKSSRKRISGPPTIRDCLGPKPRQGDTLNKPGSGAQAPEESSDSEEEPKEVTKKDPEPEDMSHLDLLREVLRWRNQFKQKKQRASGRHVTT